MVWTVASIVSFTCLQENETPSFSSQKNLNNFNFNILCQLEIIRIVPDENEISFSLGGSVDLSPLSSTRTYLGFAVLADCGECPRAKLASSSCLRSSCRTISNWIVLKISGLVFQKVHTIIVYWKMDWTILYLVPPFFPQCRCWNEENVVIAKFNSYIQRDAELTASITNERERERERAFANALNKTISISWECHLLRIIIITRVHLNINEDV